jgi:hypothetical protein
MPRHDDVAGISDGATTIGERCIDEALVRSWLAPNVSFHGVSAETLRDHFKDASIHVRWLRTH